MDVNTDKGGVGCLEYCEGNVYGAYSILGVDVQGRNVNAQGFKNSRISVATSNPARRGANSNRRWCARRASMTDSSADESSEEEGDAYVYLDDQMHTN